MVFFGCMHPAPGWIGRFARGWAHAIDRDADDASYTWHLLESGRQTLVGRLGEIGNVFVRRNPLVWGAAAEKR